VNSITMWDAMRFANWMHNGQPSSGVQDATTTEDGAYTLDGYNWTDGSWISRNPGARFWVPSDDEWYKAAYYDPVAGKYWDYPTGTDTPPSNDVVNPDPGNNANFWNGPGDFSIGPPYLHTEVGEFENSASPYGTFDQGGNVWEPTDTIVPCNGNVSCRVVRGGSSYQHPLVDSDLPLLAAQNRFYNYVTGVGSNYGFRIASLPVNEILPGDYNANGTVDAADYTVWRNRLGQSESLPNDDTTGVGADDYDRWRTHFGESIGSGAGDLTNIPVPEPATLVMLILAATGWCHRRSRNE
jgi:Sulfatase-modifying factor enzyme 1